MKIGSIEISNILSIEKARIDFQDTGLVLIEGYNHDDATANGAGKTAIANALAFGLYGKMPRKITASGILKYGAKTGYVIVNDIITHDGTWSVKRSRPTSVIFYKNGIERDITQAEFESKLKLNYSQFLIAMYSAQTNGEKFIEMNDAAKKDFLLKLMNLEDFSNAKTVADQECKTLERELQTLQLQEATAISRIQVFEESIVDTSALTDEIKKHNQIVSQCHKAIQQDSIISKPDLSQFIDLQNEIKQKQVAIQTAAINRRQLVQQFKTLSNKYIATKNDQLPTEQVECPECNKHIYKIDNKLISVSNLQEIQNAKNATLQDLKDQCKALKQQIDELDLITAGQADIDALENTMQQQKDSLYTEYNAALARIAENKSLMAQQQIKIDHLNGKISDNASKQQELTHSKKQLKQLKKDINSKTAELELLKTVAHIYSPAGAPAYIMDSVIDDFNNAIKKYVDLVWYNASYSIQVFKENKSGEIRAKFSDKLLVNGQAVDIGSLSGGQLRCLSLSIDFAILDVLASRFSIDINPIIFDEPLSGLDIANKERILNILEQIATQRQIIIIEHTSEFKSAFANVINVELKNGTSIVTI